MTIKNMDQFIGALWDWGILNGCFGDSNISVTDIDGIIEKNGHFLLLEAKGPKAKVSIAQNILHKALIQTGLFTIVIIWGERNQPQKMKVFFPNGQKTGVIESNLEDFRKIVSRWYDYALKQNAV